MQHLSIEESNAVIAAVRADAFHLEVADDHSQVADESEPFGRFLAGLEPFADGQYPPSWAEWDDLVTDVTGRGARIRRLRIVTEPLSDYLRFEHHMTARNIGLGEDIRWLARHHLDIGDYTRDEWWLLDDERVAFTLFTDAGDFTGTALTDDPDIVARCRHVRDRLWDRAIPHEKYVPGGTG